MKPSRYIARPGYPRDPAGKLLCRGCGKPVGPGRRTWCGESCVHAYKLRHDGVYLRAQVFKRDRGICAVCGIDAESLRRSSDGWHVRGVWIMDHPAPHYCSNSKLYLDWLRTADSMISVAQARAKELRALGWPSRRRTFWDADHIVEVVNGGGACDLSNIQTLCCLCHRKKTAALRKDLAESKRKTKSE